MSSRQSERTLWGGGGGGRGGAPKRTRANKWEEGSKLGSLERTYFFKVPIVHMHKVIV